MRGISQSGLSCIIRSHCPPAWHWHAHPDFEEVDVQPRRSGSLTPRRSTSSANASRGYLSSQIRDTPPRGCLRVGTPPDAPVRTGYWLRSPDEFSEDRLFVDRSFDGIVIHEIQQFPKIFGLAFHLARTNVALPILKGMYCHVLANECAELRVC